MTIRNWPRLAAHSSVLLACAAYAAGCASLQSLPDPPTAPAVAPIVAPSAGSSSQLRRTATPAPRIPATRAATASWVPDDSEDDPFGGFFYRPYYPASKPRAGRS